MSESGNSNQVSGAPSYNSLRFSEPRWVVKINDLEVKNVILEKIELGFGNDTSTATFTLPNDPFDINNPVVNDSVDIIVNNKRIFRGYISVKSDSISRAGLKITYVAISNVANLNKDTILFGQYLGKTELLGIFNEPSDTTSPFRGVFLSAKQIFEILGIPASNVPDVFTGAINIVDQTKLTAAQSILAKVGNYKLYYNMETDSLEVYAFGSGGTNTRSFIKGKNIINYNVSKSIENVVNKIIVVGAPAQITTISPLTGQIKIGDNGRTETVFSVAGKNIRDILVEGVMREKPDIEYYNDMQINEAMMGGIDLQLYPAVKKITNHQLTLSQVSANFVYHKSYNPNGLDTVQILLSEIPKIWFAQTDSGFIESLGGFFEIVTGFTYQEGSMRVTATRDGSRPFVEVGTGDIVRSIVDNSYQIVVSAVTGENNTITVTENMQFRAQAEYDKLHLPNISGSITVLGDETIDLKTTILIDNELLDITHITHDFTNGFSTTVTLTNEKLQIINNLIPRATRGTTEKERQLLQHIQITDDGLLKQRASQTDTAPNVTIFNPPSSGPYAIYHP